MGSGPRSESPDQHRSPTQFNKLQRSSLRSFIIKLRRGDSYQKLDILHRHALVVSLHPARPRRRRQAHANTTSVLVILLPPFALPDCLLDF